MKIYKFLCIVIGMQLLSTTQVFPIFRFQEGPKKTALGFHESQTPEAVQCTHINNSIEVSCWGRRSSDENEAFKKFVLQSIATTNKNNPGRWIYLNLRLNSFNDNDHAFLQDLISSVAAKTKELHIDVAGISLWGGHQSIDNQLTSLPENLFSELTHLDAIDLRYNRLTSLRPNIFRGLVNLKKLYLSGNQLTSLPEHIFDGLNNLRILDLSRNQLQRKTNQELHLNARVRVAW